MKDSDQVMARVRDKALVLGLADHDAARAIGVTPASYVRHLQGAYVRSDSVAKYRLWLEGTNTLAPVVNKDSSAAFISRPSDLSRVEPLRGAKAMPGTPHRIVDLFGGCGGLSLGFELAGGGGLYRTVLAIDIEDAMVRVFNANHPSRDPRLRIGRQADLSEFLNEAEVLAYYLDHLAGIEVNAELASQLEELEPAGLGELVSSIQRLDQHFAERLQVIRSSRSYLNAYAAVPKSSLSQTSILGFHKTLKLPQPGTGLASFDFPLWGAATRPITGASVKSVVAPEWLLEQCRSEADELWRLEVRKLRERTRGEGSGQLASAAKKIKESLRLLESTAYVAVKSAWLDWRSQRDAARRHFFEDDTTLDKLRSIYRAGHQVQVLLGGPPCQGFSRIGRGKIRSLREQSVHVQSDAKAGDKRNELMLQYVLFVAALAPSTFLFENVRHFQAEVKTPEGTFSATALLAEAISNISRSGLEYEIGSRIIVASDHLVPQNRERFFMVGVRQDVAVASGKNSAAEFCLSLPFRPPVALKHALAGLPAPVHSGAGAGAGTRLPVEDLHFRIHSAGNGAISEYLEWIRQPPPEDRPAHDHRMIDAHCARDSRPDDRAFFEMLGPGKRWMDYRCDDNPIVADLARLVAWAIKSQSGSEIDGLNVGRLRELLESLDGSLSLRLLLDQIPLEPGEVRHHLSASNYLKKREGSHGDWLARLDPETPSKTMVSHMGKDTYAFVHPSSPRTISVREAARVQTFPDWYDFGSVGLVDGYRVVGNAVPPLLSSQLALRVSVLLEGWASLQSIDSQRSAQPKQHAIPRVHLQPG